MTDAVTLNIGGSAVGLVFHSPRLEAAILPAFQHLLGVDKPALTVHLHDRTDGNEALKWAESLAPQADDGAFGLMDGTDRTLFAQSGGGGAATLDWGRNEAHWAVPGGGDVPYIERSAPLRPLLTHWLARRCRHIVHAAAVGDARGAVLIVGHGGAGKSTTALVCLEAGMAYLADDHCLVESGPEPAVSSLFSTGKLALRQLDDFPALSAAAETVGRPADEKVVLFLSRLVDRPLMRRLPLRAILLARITGGPGTALRPLSRAAAFRAIAPSCALHFPSARAAALRCFAALVRDLPAHVLELGTERSAIPEVIRALLAEPPRAVDGRHV